MKRSACAIKPGILDQMKSLGQHLCTYASYHRDRRNIATHFFGIPMIVLGTSTLLSRPSWLIEGLPLSPAILATAGAAVFYFLLDLRLGLVMTTLFSLSAWAGAALAAERTAIWLGAGLGLSAVGWVIQFVGHYYEGKKPAFVDDVAGFLVGPLFIVAETAFALGLRPELRETIEASVGPTIIRPLRPTTQGGQ